jgi:hypothetical protein
LRSAFGFALFWLNVIINIWVLKFSAAAPRSVHSIITICGACNLNALPFEKAILGFTNLLINDSIISAPTALAKI